ncbi:MAG: lipoyl(octanoyl) transferase LipB [Bacteroidales bacterium]|nr:lipoyl(octanoyl) transferase LipB [Bacteroidales bacterium]
MSYRAVYQDIGVRDYKAAWDYQEKVFTRLVSEKISWSNNSDGYDEYTPGTLIFVEHPHVYTLGKSGSENNLLLDALQLKAKEADFYRTNRGGDITYHGPGQVVGYPIFDLNRMGLSLREYIHCLEEAIILTLREFGLKGSRLTGATGVWLDPEITGRARKICAIGVKASRYVTMHGFAFNVNTDLSYFGYINPCGFTDKGVTSMKNELGAAQDIESAKMIIRKNLQNVFDLTWVEY